MPSFLNKVFGHKRHDDKEPGAISPVLSPSLPTFSDSDRDASFSFFKAKYRTSHKSPQKNPDAIPHLTLHLPGPKEGADSRELGIVFEADPDSQTLLDDVVIAAKRLSPLEALILVRLCAQAITERGLETVGVMHPHWFSASPDVQRKLISLFIRSLSPQNQPTTFSPTPTSPTSAFENELHYTRSPHDVAAVLRWALRHLSLENGHFAKDSAEWAWYSAFFNAERSASYPPKGFSELVLPQLPISHIEILSSILSLVSSLAAHVERSGTSGSRLCKFLGLWLLVATPAEQSDDWYQFYARWERAGRILEHLFLARLREESFTQRLPTRLQELVLHYPYKGSCASEDDLLPRPRFSTRQYDALLVRVETVLVQGTEQPKKQPIQLLLEAFQLPIDNLAKDEHVAFWNTLKTLVSEEATSSDSEGLQFTSIFADDTIQLLALLPADNTSSSSPIFLTSPISKVVSRKPSSTPTKASEPFASTPASPTSPSSPAIADWTEFSLSGFGDAPSTQPLAALLEPNEDAEAPAQLSRKSSRQRSRRRRSQEYPATPPNELESIIETKLGSIHVVQIDEAFIDFWSDAIVDPISSNWPTFVICGLKQISNTEQPLRWLVIEQMYSRQELQPARLPSPEGRRGRSPRPSFKSDVSGFRINSMFSSARKRFSVFSKSVTDLDPKKSGRRSPVSGELGKAPVEEEPTFPFIKAASLAGAVGTTITSYTAAVVADQLKADEISTAPINGVPPKAAAKARSVEATPRVHNGSASHVGTSKEAGVVERGLPCARGGVDTGVNSADPVTGTTALPSIIDGETQADAGRIQQNGLTNGDGPLAAESAGDSANAAQVGSQLEDAEVAMPPVPPTAAAAVNEAPEVVAEKPRVAEQPSEATSTDFVAASTVDVPSLSTAVALDKVVSTEAGAQLEPDSISCTIDTPQEAKEVAEIRIAPQVVSSKEPSPEILVYAYQRARTVAQVPAAEPEAPENVIPLQTSHDAASAPEALENAAAQSVAAECAAESSAQGPSVETAPATDAKRGLAVEAEHAADHVPMLATEEARPLAINQAAEAPLVHVLSVPEAGADVAVRPRAEPNSLASDARVVVESQEDVGVSTPVPESAEVIHETPSPETASELSESVGAAPAEAVDAATSVPLSQDARPLVGGCPYFIAPLDNLPVTNRARVHVDVVRSASEPSTAMQDVRAHVESETFGEMTAQSVDEAAKSPRDVVSVPEETATVQDQESGCTTVVVVDDPREAGPDVGEEARGLASAEADEASLADGKTSAVETGESQRVGNIALVASDVDVSEGSVPIEA